MDVGLGAVRGNIDAIGRHAAIAAKEGAELIIFPECAVTGYCFDSLDAALELAESIPGASTAMLESLCRKLSCFVVVGMLEKVGEKTVYNVSVLVGPEGVVGKYRKAHLPFLGASSRQSLEWD